MCATKGKGGVADAILIDGEVSVEVRGREGELEASGFIGGLGPIDIKLVD